LCSSDEETEDVGALQFLPIAPEVEEPEEGWTAGQSTAITSADAEKQRSKENDSPVPAKKKKYKMYEINLENAPKDGEYLK